MRTEVSLLPPPPRPTENSCPSRPFKNVNLRKMCPVTNLNNFTVTCNVF